jgi:hypothetical protein
MSQEQRKAKMAAIHAELANRRKMTSANAYDFLGNLGVKQGFLDDVSPAEIAIRVRGVLISHVPMFQTDETGGFLISAEGRLVPLEGMQETDGVFLRHIEKLYLSAREPLTLDQLRPLLAPLEAGAQRFRYPVSPRPPKIP